MDRFDNFKNANAKLFQKIVLKVEKLKYHLLKNQLSFLVPMTEKSIKKRFDRLISKATKDEEKQMFSEIYKKQIILFRKELQLESNRNYHYGIDYNKDFKDYLLWNKNTHLKQLEKNLLMIASGSIMTYYGNNIIDIVGVILIACNSISSIINLECINLQNYHLNRYEKIEGSINKKKEEYLLEKNNEYKNAIESINKQIKNSEEIPKINVYDMKKQELYEFRQMLIELKKKNNKVRERRL